MHNEPCGRTKPTAASLRCRSGILLASGRGNPRDDVVLTRRRCLPVQRVTRMSAASAQFRMVQGYLCCAQTSAPHGDPCLSPLAATDLWLPLVGRLRDPFAILACPFSFLQHMGLLQKNKLSPWSAWGSLLLPPRSSLQKMNGVNRMCNTILTKKGGESALRSAQWRAHLARVENRLPLCADTVRVGASLR